MGEQVRFGYNTNGFAHHRLDDALAILAELGYESVALTVDHHVLNPFASEVGQEVERVRGLLEKNRLGCVIETGARFLLDPRRKHQPTLIGATQAERQSRLYFLGACVDLAQALGADAVSFWSGTATDEPGREVLFDRLVDGCQRLAERAQKANVRLAFEPEPGMLIDTMKSFAELHVRVGSPGFGLTLDVGHLHCQGEEPIAGHIKHWRKWLWNVHIEDMRRGVHDHLMFGEGEMDFPPILGALEEVGYLGGVHVELSRHSHDAVNTARRSLSFLRGCLPE